MNSKDSKLSKSKERALEALFDIKYVDGKPVRVKVDPLQELRDELEPEEDVNQADVVKSALYADLPKAKAKMDRSITARALNQTLESYNRKRESAIAGFSSITGFENRWQDFMKDEWKFRWDKVNGTLKTVQKPENGFNLEYKSKKLIQFIADEPGAQEFVLKIMQDHMNRRK